MKNLSALVLFCLFFASPAEALTKELATYRARTLVHALLMGDLDAASRHTGSDVTPWIAMLGEAFPKSDTEDIRYEVADAVGPESNRRCVVRVERGQARKVYYVEFDGPQIAGFHSIHGLVSVYQERLKAESEQLFRMMTDWDSEDWEGTDAVVRAIRDYAAVVEEVRAEVQWYREWLLNHAAPQGYGSSAGRDPR